LSGTPKRPFAYVIRSPVVGIVERVYVAIRS